MSSRSKRGRRRNRGRFSLLFKLLAGAALVAAFGATVFFQVEHILIAGNSRYTAQEVEEASGIQLGDNLFRLNKGQISEDIRRKLPYVEELTIVRHLPSTIAIEIREWDAGLQRRRHQRRRRQRTLNCPKRPGRRPGKLGSSAWAAVCWNPLRRTAQR